ncbi:COP9 signalosome complex subunit 8 [Musca domestica]|uniref:COP9 signalosome complex subunit 8 n=1 Tax=Musca domestica TaxID=7370 RepID=A0A1I8MCW9_MUSDO|nr:COP9 signalosome complex subunit 8 [Musca domestica]
MESYQDLILDLERQELEAQDPSSALYIKLFACYLVENKLHDAKFLWKRLPQTLCKENEDLKALHVILRSLLANNILELLQHIEREWPEDIKPIMEDLLRTTEQNIIGTVQNAYTSIVKKNLIDAIDAYQKHMNGTSLSDDNSSSYCVSRNAMSVVSSEHQLSKLTGFVSFLEN